MAGAGSQRFPKSLRLRKRREFLAVQRTGATVHGRYFLAIVGAGAQPDGRVGITVSKRVGKAVTRNRIKRWVREYVRQNRSSFLPTEADVVVVAKAAAAQLERYDAVAADLGRLGEKLQR